MKPAFNPIRMLAEVMLIVALAQAAITFGLPLLGLAATGPRSTLPNAAMVLLLVLVAGPTVYWRCMAGARRGSPVAAPRLNPRAGSKVGSAVAMTAAAQLLGLALTAGGIVWQQRALDDAARSRFERGTERIEAEIKRRLTQPLYGMNGARGMYAGGAAIDATAFQAYVESRDLAGEFPGVRGFGFVQRVMRGELEAFTAEMRAHGASDFTVRSSGSAPDLYVTKHIEPLATNRAAWGFDLGQEAVRREAAERAISSGEPALSGRITLVQDGKKGPGFLYFVPVFRRGTDSGSPQQRLNALVGLLYTPIVVAEFMSGVAEAADHTLDFQLFDVDAAPADRLLFEFGRHLDSGNLTATDVTGHQLETSRGFAVGGRALALHVTTSPAFDAAIDRSSLAVVAVGGALASGLLALTVWLLAVGRVRAQNQAQRMTTDLDRLARVAQYTSNIVIIIDAARRITWVNDGFTRITGYTLAEAEGRTTGELLRSDKTDPATIKILMAALAAGTACRVELLNRAKDGREHWIDVETQPTYDAQGVLIGFMQIGTDVTARRALDDQLRHGHELLAGVIANLPCGLSVFDADLRLVAHNAEVRRLLDLPDHLFAGPETTYEQIVRFNAARGEYGPGEIDAIVAPIIARARRMRPHAFEVQRPNGVITEARGTRMPGGGFITTYTDISARKRAEAEAARAQVVLRGAIDAIDEAFVLYDPDDRLVLCNDKYREFYPSVADLIVPGVRFEDLVRAEAQRGDAAASVDQVEERVAGRVAVHRAANTTEVQLLSNGRTLRIVERRMPDGHIVGFRVDITAFVEATKAAEAASRSKSQFLANMSHDIRTPMNAILGMLKLLQNTALNARQLDYTRKTEGAARSLLGLLNDILDFSKVDAGKMTLDPRPFRTDRLLRELSTILSANVGDKDIEVLYDIDPALPRGLLGDDMRLQQVLINLGGNAIKFTSVGQVVLRLRALELTEHDVLLDVAVRDSGIGIAPENQVHIFSGFSQAEASTTRRFGGTGLGLAICQRLVGLMGGELRLDSRLGEGSTFQFQLRLPLADVPADVLADVAVDLPADEPQALPPPEMSALQTLIVDDNASARELLAGMVGSLGWQADVAASGAEAIALAQARGAAGGAYQVIFVDWQMPGLGGLQTSQRLRQMPAVADTALIVMITAHGPETLAQRSAQEQALLNGFLVKPVTASMLFDAVVDARIALAHPQALSQPALDRAQRLEGMRLLVVEDNLNNQQVAQELLEDEGANVTLAGNGALGVAAVATALSAALPFDAVLMDLQMPVMDGYTAAAQIRHQLGLAGLPIIAMTANAMASDREACLAAGMNDHIGKPFDLNRLVSTLLHWTGRASALVEASAPKAAIAMAATGLPDAVLAEASSSGIDLAAALERMGGNRGVYRRLLGSFAKDLAALAGQFDTLLHQRERAEASHLMHTIKGLAATLGLLPLNLVAAAAEKALLSPETPDEHAALSDGLQAATTTALQAIARLSEALRAATPAPVTLSQSDTVSARASARASAESLHDTVGELIGLLRSADMRALDVFEQLRQAHAPQLQPALQPLADAMAALDFTLALARCEAVTAAVAK